MVLILTSVNCSPIGAFARDMMTCSKISVSWSTGLVFILRFWLKVQVELYHYGFKRDVVFLQQAFDVISEIVMPIGTIGSDVEKRYVVLKQPRH